MTTLALLFIGHSVFSALALALTHLRAEPYRERRQAQVAGVLLLLALAGLQGAHLAWLQFDVDGTATPLYRATLFAVAPAFFVFSRPVLLPQAEDLPPRVLLLHAVPALVGWVWPGPWAWPLAFGLGAGYLAWLARRLYSLRQQRANFHLELLLLGVVFAVALAVAVLGVGARALPGRVFFSLYACAIGLAFVLVQLALGRRPQLAAELRDSARAAYASTTLARVDCDDALARLQALVQGQRLYTDPDLGLASLAARLGLSPHQLSELVNTRLGKGLSRYLRECRVDAAKAMLLAEPRASVLSVGLSVGFTSQSNFYEAFRDIEGSTPGQYRKLHTPGATPP